MGAEEQIRKVLKELKEEKVEICIPAHFLERMLNWFDFCEVEGFSNELDHEILNFLSKTFVYDKK